LGFVDICSLLYAENKLRRQEKTGGNIYEITQPLNVTFLLKNRFLKGSCEIQVSVLPQWSRHLCYHSVIS
jgi:hypothetical protein